MSTEKNEALAVSAPFSRKIENLRIRKTLSVKQALKQMGVGGEKILFVVDDGNRLLGTLTDGDIRRWILKEGNLGDPVCGLYQRSPVALGPQYDLAQVKEIMIREKIEVIPVTDENGILIDSLFWSDIFSEQPRGPRPSLAVPVLVMAGGKGARLDPFTKILPKPLIPLGDKPIVEIVMDRFAEFGCRDFYLTVNYKGKMIQSYFENEVCPHEIHFIWEEAASGTAGSLRLAKDQIDAANLFVTNCDILVTADYADIFEFHQTHQNDITVVGSVQHFEVPYGVIEMKNGGLLQKIIEKPEYDFLVNTGFYVIKKSVIDLIPTAGVFDFTDLIAKVKEEGGRVGVYPVGQDSWMDIGQWADYKKALKKLER